MAIGRPCSCLIKTEFCCCHGNRIGGNIYNYQWVNYCDILSSQKQDFGPRSLLWLRIRQTGESDLNHLAPVCPVNLPVLLSTTQ